MNNPNQSYFDKYFDPVVRDIDRVNIYEFENGMDYELTQSGKEINLDSIKSAQAKVLKNLKKDPAYYTNMLAAESVKMFGEYGSGKGKSSKSTTAKEAEAVKKDGKSPKINKQDSPFGVKNELKGRYKSSGMEPTKKVPGSLNESMKNEYFYYGDSDVSKSDKIKVSGEDELKRRASLGKNPMLKYGSEFKEKDKYGDTYKLKGPKGQLPEDYPAEYFHGRLMPEEDETKEKSAYDKKREEDEKAKEMARNAMKKSLGLKKEDVNVGDSRKIRLTPTTKNQIFTLVHETIEEALFQNKLNPSQVISVKPGEAITKDSEFSSKFTKLP
jgi:hypothetical protein